MPQMAPLSWLILFFFFIVIFMILNSLNYFSFSYPPKMKTKKVYSKFINWKW
uniref:ATP synthase F0 subunit 8 n=1 Tax=Sinelater perroti TaxID=1028068 RepID=UPI002115B874|nr:ATP synthase F0 subunit 8 [Sinelater perroti]UTS56948.1 ATP synthase F0 subunit 8 [Sinelater perroti]